MLESQQFTQFTHIYIPPGILYFVTNASRHVEDFSTSNIILLEQSFVSISLSTRCDILHKALWLRPIKKSFPTQYWKLPLDRSESVAASCKICGTAVDICPENFNWDNTYLKASFVSRNLCLNLKYNYIKLQHLYTLNTCILT